jgi:hypothetical protein
MLSVGTSRMSSERQVWFKFSKVYSIIKREENSHANRCIYRLLIIARVYKQHRRSVLYVCFLWPFEFRRAPATFTHLFLIGFCVCVLSFLVCCFANVAIDRRHDRPILPSYTRLVRMSILCDGPPFLKHSVACSTTTVTKCQAGLRTLQAFPVFHPTCLCREPSVDPDCNAFRDSLFDHPCMVATQKGRLYNLFFFGPSIIIIYTVEIRNKIKWRKSYLSVQIILFRVARRLSNPTQQKKKKNWQSENNV